MRRASLTPKANECAVPHCLSDGSPLSVLWKSLISVVTFHWARKARHEGCLWKSTPLLFLAYFYHKSLGQHCNKTERPLCLKKFSSGEAKPPKTNDVALLVYKGVFTEDTGNKAHKSCRSPQHWDHALITKPKFPLSVAAYSPTEIKLCVLTATAYISAL